MNVVVKGSNNRGKNTVEVFGDELCEAVTIGDNGAVWVITCMYLGKKVNGENVRDADDEEMRSWLLQYRKQSFYSEMWNHGQGIYRKWCHDVGKVTCGKLVRLEF